MARARPFAGIRVAITRPAGTGAAWARRVCELGGTPLLLPGASLRPAADAIAARKALRAALTGEVAIFTSPAAVRFARALGLPRTRTRVLAPGAGTRRALQRAGFPRAEAPVREDSEGILALPVLQCIRGLRVGLVGAAGGRGLLDRELAARGAAVVRANVYQRQPARLDRRHAETLRLDTRKPLYVLLSSAEALANILAALPADARCAFSAGSAVVSSARLVTAAHKAGFARVLRAASANVDAMLAAVADDAAPGAASMPP